MVNGTAVGPDGVTGSLSSASERASISGQEPPCSCARLRAGVRLRCARFEQWSQACHARAQVPPGRYSELLADAAHVVDSATNRQIAMDVDRTCPMLSFFQSGGGGRDMLTNILVAWVVYDGTQQHVPSELKKVPIGYVQGMSFIAMNLLWHAGREEAAFLVFVAMMQQYDLRSMFEPPDLRGLKARASTVTQLLRLRMPDLSDHLAEYLNNSLDILLTDWLLTLFASSVALAPLALIWDRFFEQGYRAIYRCILARLRCLRPWLLHEKDFMNLAHLMRFAHIDFDRIEGALVPRLRNHKLESVPAVAAGPSSSAGPSSLLGRVAQSAVAIVTAPLRSGSSSQSGGTAAQQMDDMAMRGHPAAWTCHLCNGSEECESWLCLGTELLQEEDICDADVERFERMFDSGVKYAGKLSLMFEPVRPKQSASPREGDLDTAGAVSSANSVQGSPSGDREVSTGQLGAGPPARADGSNQEEDELTRVKRENEALRSENIALRTQNTALQRFVLDLQRKLYDVDPEMKPTRACMR
eukprot:TRINITY_DN93813_c0_g1_i1.p1 TRINITY_DN93813_c0_g1~~TRINITY_DN93813_c0_g1_i1.p1  ORF type:complete len:559 (+),score=49.16 TRINITY_DN93813_c0_g1_i1:96-1679(+)